MARVATAIYLPWAGDNVHETTARDLQPLIIAPRLLKVLKTYLHNFHINSFQF